MASSPRTQGFPPHLFPAIYSRKPEGSVQVWTPAIICCLLFFQLPYHRACRRVAAFPPFSLGLCICVLWLMTLFHYLAFPSSSMVMPLRVSGEETYDPTF
jgi:hypothetical protein